MDWSHLLTVIRQQGYDGSDELEAVRPWFVKNDYDPDAVEIGDGKTKTLDELYTGRKGRLFDAGPAVALASRQAEVSRLVQQELDDVHKAVGDLTPVERNGAKAHGQIKVRDRLEDDPNLGYRPYSQSGLGQWLGDVRKAAEMTEAGRPSDLPERLVKCQAITEARTKAGLGMQESLDSEGGFLVSPEHSNMLLKKMHDTGLVANQCRQINMQRRQFTIPFIVETSRVDGSRHGGVQGYWTGEGVAATASQPAFGKLTLNAHRLGAIGYVTDELEDDSDPAALQLLGELFAEELAFKLDDAIINGDGAGKPLGVLNSSALITVTRANNDVIEGSDIIGMWSRLWAKSRPTAVWFINQDAEPSLAAAAMAGTPSGAQGGMGLFWTPATQGGVGAGTVMPLLLGRPVITIEHMASTAAPNTFGLFDMQQYLLGRRSGIDTASSIHVRFTQHEMAFRATMRVDGQPWWESTLTPFNSTITQSPFITVAT